MHIIKLSKKDFDYIEQSAKLLVEAFPHAWENLTDGIKEVNNCIKRSKVALVAIDNNQVLGFIGAQPMYDNTGWELHPLVVKPTSQRQGVGKELVARLEVEIVKKGGVVIYLGTDDEFNKTSLSNCDLYDNLYERIINIKNYKNHPYEFYQKVGFMIVGVIPDANGRGKPDIYMAKKISVANK